METVIQLQLT